jgi:hypothetical protein
MVGHLGDGPAVAAGLEAPFLKQAAIMNPSIWQRLDRLEQELCTSPIIAEYHILRWEIAQASGQVRVRICLVDGGLLDLFEYVVVGSNDALTVSKYRYHWQNGDGDIVRRWDNATHHTDLPHTPHHVHLPDGQVQGVDPAPSITAVLDEIQANLRMEETTNV